MCRTGRDEPAVQPQSRRAPAPASCAHGLQRPHDALVPGSGRQKRLAVCGVHSLAHPQIFSHASPHGRSQIFN